MWGGVEVGMGKVATLNQGGQVWNFPLIFSIPTIIWAIKLVWEIVDPSKNSQKKKKTFIILTWLDFTITCSKNKFLFAKTVPFKWHIYSFAHTHKSLGFFFFFFFLTMCASVKTCTVQQHTFLFCQQHTEYPWW